MASTTFYLIRHGEIEANVLKLWYGSTDTELTPAGEWQAEQMGEYLHVNCPEITAVYASPLKRTRKTAMALSQRLGLDLQTHSGLREYGIGVLEGMSFDSLMGEHQFFASIAEDQDYAPDQGESINQVRDRMIDALETIAAQHPDQAVAIVSHGAAMAITMARVLDGCAFPFSDYHMANTGVTQLEWDDSAKLVLFDQTTHLTQETTV